MQHPVVALVGVTAVALLGSTASAERRCADYDELRRPLYGDFHVHTGFSFDAWTMDQRTTPDDAYRYASGSAIKIPPLDADGEMTRTIRIDRPLDFAAVTDHAAGFFGAVALFASSGSSVYASVYCRCSRAAG